MVIEQFWNEIFKPLFIIDDFIIIIIILESSAQHWHLNNWGHVALQSAASASLLSPSRVKTVHPDTSEGRCKDTPLSTATTFPLLPEPRHQESEQEVPWPGGRVENQ